MTCAAVDGEWFPNACLVIRSFSSWQVGARVMRVVGCLEASLYVVLAHVACSFGGRGVWSLFPGVDNEFA